jgi:DNA-directed RNA polymerase subunit alpha
MIDLELSEVQVKEISKNHEVLTITPLPTGYGTTIGTALRRVMLSSLDGAAITAIKIAGVTHEFSTVPGIKDSVVDVILNLKQIRFNIHTNEPVIGKISAKSAGPIYAKDIQLPGDAKVVNEDLLITTIETKTKLEIELIIEKGVGFEPVINREKRLKKEPNQIEIDAFFSPVKKVSFKVSATRVGQATDLDKLEMEVQTDGSLSPKEALSKSAGILRNYFGLLDPEYLTSDQKKSLKSEVQPEDDNEDQETILGKKSGRKYTPVEVLKLSPRTLNALINNKIDSVEQLITFNESKLSNLKGFGAKALFEVREALTIIGQELSNE